MVPGSDFRPPMTLSPIPAVAMARSFSLLPPQISWVNIPAVFKFSRSDQIGAWNARLSGLPSFGSHIGINPENCDPIYLPRSFL